MWKRVIYAILILILSVFFIGTLINIEKKEKKNKKILSFSVAGVFVISIIMQLVDPFIFGT